MKPFNPIKEVQTKYVFYTGKGGVGKTSVACATAVCLADSGKKVLLVSTDPASNLQDVFETELSGTPTPISQISGLYVANLDPVMAAQEYKQSVIAPYLGKLPDSVIANMEEQLSGSCTVEIAAFNEFTNFLASEEVEEAYDVILFDTAPTGHTLRMLQLPSAWSNFISENTHGASCLGQLSGLEDRKELYKKAMQQLQTPSSTTLFLVSRPEKTPLLEAQRASDELRCLGIRNQKLVINGVLQKYDDDVSAHLFQKQQHAIQNMPQELSQLPVFSLPLRAYNITGVHNIRAFLGEDTAFEEQKTVQYSEMKTLKDTVEDLDRENKKVIFTMGKGGVGKTTIAAAIALGLSKKGKRVLLATTDPAAHLNFVMNESQNIELTHIDEEAELKKYQQEVLEKARQTMSEEDLAYIEEDLRSPCTQEIAVFRRFAQIVEEANDRVVIIDTAPTGHTLLLLDSTQSYHREVKRTGGETPQAVKNLLPRLTSSETAVLIITLPEATPVFEALRLEEDLQRANIPTKWWVINSSWYQTHTTNKLLLAKAAHETEWINKVDKHTGGKFAMIGWSADELSGDALQRIL